MKYAEFKQMYKKAALPPVDINPMALEVANARNTIDQLPTADELRDRMTQAKDTVQPLINDLRERYQPIIDDVKSRIYNGLSSANWNKTNANAASIGVGGATALGTYGLTGLVPGLKKSMGLRLLLAAITGGLAGTYTSGGLNDMALKNSIAKI